MLKNHFVQVHTLFQSRSLSTGEVEGSPFQEVEVALPAELIRNAKETC